MNHETRNWLTFYWKNVRTNILNQGVSLFCGLLIFRLIYSNLSREEIGFYHLLWSMFGYTIFLDFGWGVATQRTVASALIKKDSTQAIATTFWLFTLLGSLLFATLILVRPLFFHLIDVSENQIPPFTKAYVLFAAIMGLAMPLAIFKEVLNGLQRVHLFNRMAAATSLASLALFQIAFYYHWSFPILVLIGTVSTITPLASCVFWAKKFIPEITLHPRHLTLQPLSDSFAFSMAAYLNFSSQAIMTRVDHLVVSMVAGVEWVALYHVGWRLAEVFERFVKNAQLPFLPAAAEVWNEQKPEEARALLLQAHRLIFWLGTPLYLAGALLMHPIIQFLTTWPEIPPAVYWIGQILLLGAYSSILTHGSTKRILLMCGEAKQISILSIVEAASNLVLSIALCLSIGIVGVAIGTLVPSLIIGWLILIPAAAAFCQLKTSSFLRQTVARKP